MSYTIRIRKMDDTTEERPEEYPTLARAFRAARDELLINPEKYALAIILGGSTKMGAVDTRGFFYNLQKP